MSNGLKEELAKEMYIIRVRIQKKYMELKKLFPCLRLYIRVLTAML